MERRAEGRRVSGLAFPAARPRRRLLAVLLLAALAAPACYRPTIVEGPPAPDKLVGLQGGGRWPAVRGLKLHVFNTGENRVSPLLVGMPAPWRPTPSFVIRHPQRGLIVFDCGLSPQVARRAEGVLHPITRLLFKTRSLPGRDLASQMQAAGFDPARVRTVVLSHLHFDHVGGCDAFTKAHFVVGRGEREAGRSRMQGFAPAHTDWVRPQAWREIDFDEGRPYATFDSTVDLFGDGSVILVRGGGHTVGGMGALLQLPGGPVLLTGDMVVHFDWLEGDDVQRIVADGERAADVRNRIRRLRRLVPRLLVFPGHDLPTVQRQREDIVVHDRAMFEADAWPID